MMARQALLLPLMALAACVSAEPRLPQEEFAGSTTLNTPIELGDVILTPLAIVEDSRCVASTQCVSAGRAIVRTRVEHLGEDNVFDLELGLIARFSYGTIELVGLTPRPSEATDGEIALVSYRHVINPPAHWGR